MPYITLTSDIDLYNGTCIFSEYPANDLLNKLQVEKVQGDRHNYNTKWSHIVVLNILEEEGYQLVGQSGGRRETVWTMWKPIQADNNSKIITLKVHSIAGQEHQLQIKYREPLTGLKTEYSKAAKLCFPPSSLFYFHGRPLNENVTPESLGMQDGDVVMFYLKNPNS